MALVILLFLALTGCTPTKNDYLRALIKYEDSSSSLLHTKEIQIERMPGSILPQIIVNTPSKKTFSLSAFDDLQLTHPLSAIRILPNKDNVALLFGEGTQTILGVIQENESSRVQFPNLYDLTWKDDSRILLSIRDKDKNSIIEYDPHSKNSVTINTVPADRFLLLPKSHNPYSSTALLNSPYIRKHSQIEARDKHKIELTQYTSYAEANGPLLLYVYGAYGEKLDASLSIYDYPYLDHGITIAFADIRSSPSGEKRISVNDLEDVVDAISEKNRKIFLHTRSAGALPVVQVLKSKRDKINGAILEAPMMYLTDLEKYKITWDESEWGERESSIAKNNTDFFSPNTEKLPSIFVWASKNDSIIPYEAVVNWISKTNASKFFLITDEHAPHEGPHMEDKLRELKGLEYAFIMANTL